MRLCRCREFHAKLLIIIIENELQVIIIYVFSVSHYSNICHEKMSSITEMSVDDATISQLLFQFFVLICLLCLQWANGQKIKISHQHRPSTTDTDTNPICSLSLNDVYIYTLRNRVHGFCLATVYSVQRHWNSCGGHNNWTFWFKVLMAVAHNL